MTNYIDNRNLKVSYKSVQYFTRDTIFEMNYNYYYHDTM